MDKLRSLFNFEPPTKDGVNIVEMVEGLLDGSVKASICLGGNLLRAVPDQHLGGLVITPYRIPPGTVASYYPECNVLVPVNHHDLLSKTPGSKSVPVRIEREQA